MDLMCEWVKYFSINLYVPTYAYFARSCAGNICILFTSLLHLCLHFWWCYMSFFPPARSLNPSWAEQPCDSQRFIYHCVPREDMFHPPGHVAVADRFESVSWLNSGVRGWEKEKERKKKREKPFSTFTFNMICIKLLCWACIDKKNMDFRQSQTPEHLPPLSPWLASCIRR